MQTQTQSALVPIKQAAGRWGLRGAVAGAELALFSTALSGWYGLTEVVLVAGVAGSAGALVLGALAFVVKLRRRTLGDVEKDLVTAIAMLERGLIDEDDYRQIKREALAQPRGQHSNAPAVWRAALIGGLLGAAVPLLIMGGEIMGSFIPLLLAGGASVAGGTVAGGTAAAITAVGHSRLPQLPPPDRPLLDR